MKIKLASQTVETKGMKPAKCRNIKETDEYFLGKLMYEGYKNSIDDEGKTLNGYITEMKATIKGFYGPMLKNCSYVLEQNGVLISAAIVTVHKKIPLLTYVVTHPSYRNKGYSTLLINETINSLYQCNYKELYLAVTTGNNQAQHLYKKIGFKEVRTRRLNILDAIKRFSFPKKLKMKTK